MTKAVKNISLTSREELRAEIKGPQGRSFLDLRVWAAAKPEESKWPTGKGVLIPASRLKELRQLLEDLDAEMEGAVLPE